MDIKRVAFETKPVTSASVSPGITSTRPPATAHRPSREEIAAIVDGFLSKKMAEQPEPENQHAEENFNSPAAKTIVHEVIPENAVQKPVPISAVDFVSEDDVRRALESGVKIYISKKTIVTPSARDLGTEKEVFATV